MVKVWRVELGKFKGVLTTTVEELMHILNVASERGHVLRRVVVANEAAVADFLMDSVNVDSNRVRTRTHCFAGGTLVHFFSLESDDQNVI